MMKHLILFVSFYYIFFGMGTVHATDIISGNNDVIPQQDDITHIVHTVVAGETLSSISTIYFYNSHAQKIIQVINCIQDVTRIFPNQRLIIPTNNYFLEKHGLRDQLNRTRFLYEQDQQTGDLFLGIYVCMKEHRIHKGYCDDMNKFVAIQLMNNGQQNILFNSSWVEDEYWGTGNWDFIDLDGDGQVDLLGEWSQDSENYTTQVALHFTNNTYYSPCTIIDQMPLGFVHTSRDEDGAMIFEYDARYTGAKTIVKWKEIRDTCLIDATSIAVDHQNKPTPTPQPSTPFDGLFADPELHNIVINVAQANGWQIPEQVTELSHVSEIIDLNGIQHLTNLETLRIFDSKLTDLSPLAKLTKLTTLYLPDNMIFNLSGLENLKNLRELTLRENQITDISALAALTNLAYLDLQENGISDISALSNLINLRWLYLDDNPITDLSPLRTLSKLEVLRLCNNSITTIPHLTGLTSLTKLEIIKTPLTDISGIAWLTNLKELNLYHNRITDISPLDKVKNLESLDLVANPVSKGFSALTSLTKLKELSFSKESRIVDISWLSPLTSLTTLSLPQQNIEDLSVFSDLTNLKDLYLPQNNIQDLSALGKLVNLEGLSLQNNHITDVSPLSTLVNLKWLGLGGNQITDISPLVPLVHLEQLGLEDNRIADISSLAGLKDLKKLYLYNNPIRSITPLLDLSNLEDSPIDGETKFPCADIDKLWKRINWWKGVAPEKPPCISSLK